MGNRPDGSNACKSSSSRYSTGRGHDTVMQTLYRDGRADVLDAACMTFNTKTAWVVEASMSNVENSDCAMSAPTPGVDSAPCTQTVSQLGSAIALEECDQMSLPTTGWESAPATATSPLLEERQPSNYIQMLGPTR